MAKFRLKPLECDAEQYRLGLEDAWAHLWRDGVLVGRYVTKQDADRCPCKVSPGFYGETVPVLMTPTGYVMLAPGDWIVTSPSGERRLVKQDTFEATYERC